MYQIRAVDGKTTRLPLRSPIVLREHWATALQLRLMRVVELRARNNGRDCIISDTTDNNASANNFIRAGYRLYQPAYPWGWPRTLYWRKFIGRS
jgi:hypothetical protein